MGKNQDVKWIVDLYAFIQEQIFNQLGFQEHNQGAKWVT